MTNQEFYERVKSIYTNIATEMERLLDSLQEQDKLIEDLESIGTIKLEPEKEQEIKDLIDYVDELSDNLGIYF